MGPPGGSPGPGAPLATLLLLCPAHRRCTETFEKRTHCSKTSSSLSSSPLTAGRNSVYTWKASSTAIYLACLCCAAWACVNNALVPRRAAGSFYHIQDTLKTPRQSEPLPCPSVQPRLLDSGTDTYSKGKAMVYIKHALLCNSCY